MKKNILILLVVTLSVAANNTFAQTAEDALKQTFTAFDSTRSYNQQLPLVNQFKLIASKWPDNWLTNYYAAYAIVITSFVEPDKSKKESMLDEAEGYYNKIKSMEASSDEVNVLGGLLAQGRLAAKPSAYKKYGDIKDKYLDAAKAINPNNPRIYLLQGDGKYYTPKMFGGGAKAALPFYEKAQTLFASQTATDISKPYWGKNELTYMMAQCNKDLKK
jgi:hypothetical protein